MSRVAIWIANALLFVLCCFLAARLINEVAGVWLEEEPPVVAVGDGSGVSPPAAARRRDRQKVILDRNLFNVSTLAPPPPEVEPEEDLEATQLPLRLLGTAAHSDPANAWAAVQDLKNRSHLVVRLNDTLLDKAKVIRIERGRLVLDNGGHREELALEQDDGVPNGKAQARRPARVSRVPRPGAPGAPSARKLQDRIRQLRQSRAAASPAPRPPAPGRTRTPANLFSQARLLPRYEGGKMVGVQVSAIRKGSLFQQIGLQNGDTITELNGIHVTNPKESSAVLRELSEASEYAVVVTGKDGRERTLSYVQPK